MVVKRLIWAASLGLVLGSFVPSIALALGLGDIRLSSALNQPLDAEIELLNATPEELTGLKANLASRETFARYGLDYPNFLSSVTLTRGRSANGGDVLKVRSAETMTEPFVSLLVEVNWGRGRLVREYTVLLDPPVFAPNTPRVADAPAPATGAESSGSIVRPAQPTSQATASSPSVSGAASSDTYAVRRGDTLNGIAGNLAADVGVDRQQMMLGLYRSNPDAFEGNMNRLRAGAILRVPDSSSLQAISAAAANSEVSRQVASWRGQSSSASGGSGRLRLVAPGDASGSGGSATADEVRGLRDRLTQLEGELAESRRLLELRDAELAALQKQLGRDGVAATTQTPTQTPAGEPAVVTPDASAPAATAPANTTAATPDAGGTPAAGEPLPSAEAPPADATVAPPVAAEPMRPRIQATEPAESPSFLDSVLGSIRDYWQVIAGLLVLALGFFGFRKFQDYRAERELIAAQNRYADQEMQEPAPLPSVETLRRGDSGAGSEMQVEETGRRATTKPVVDADLGSSTLSGETGVNLDQGDPLAEADFHMAYGLYDQAADLVRGAITREPDRLDLKLKLVEVFFVWGNKDEFLRLAREIHASGAARKGGDWEKIVIMGRQIAPEEPLFSQSGGASALGEASVDLDLAGGDGKVDFEMAATNVGGDMDFDLGATSIADPQQSRAVANFDVSRDSSGGTTRQMLQDFQADQVEQTTSLDMDFSGAGDAPTIEQPGLQSNAPTIREKLDAAKRLSAAADDPVERTSEVAIDDLGLDIGDIEGLDLPDEPGEASADAATLVSGMDQESRRIMESASSRRDANATASLAALDGAATREMEYSLDEKTVERPAMQASNDGVTQEFPLDMDFGAKNGAAHSEAAAETLIADDVSLPPLEPVTMSEVGTKLDLARAYVDMGDPDGARNILQEVLQEGSMSQKQEAQRLLDSIPG